MACVNAWVSPACRVKRHWESLPGLGFTGGEEEIPAAVQGWWVQKVLAPSSSHPDSKRGQPYLHGQRRLTGAGWWPPVCPRPPGRLRAAPLPPARGHAEAKPTAKLPVRGRPLSPGAPGAWAPCYPASPGVSRAGEGAGLPGGCSAGAMAVPGSPGSWQGPCAPQPVRLHPFVSRPGKALSHPSCPLPPAFPAGTGPAADSAGGQGRAAARGLPRGGGWPCPAVLAAPAAPLGTATEVSAPPGPRPQPRAAVTAGPGLRGRGAGGRRGRGTGTGGPRRSEAPLRVLSRPL